MSRLRTASVRRLAAALALFGVVLYAALLPLHAVSMFQRGVDSALLGKLVICHVDATGAPVQPQNDGQEDDGSSCPICSGLCVFNIAIPAPAPAAVAAPPRGALVATLRDEDGAPASEIVANSRGPPAA